MAFVNPVRALETCGTGTWTSGNLEIHHINIGQGDSTLIVGPTGKSLLFDAGESNWKSSAKAEIIGPYIEGVLGCKSLDYVVISHFHLDHVGYVGYGGLWNLVETQGFTIGTTLVRNYNAYIGETSGTLTNWKTYFEGVGQVKFNPVTAVEGTSQVNLGTGVTFNIVTVDGNNAIIAGDFHEDASPPSENDYSIGALLSFGDFDEWIGGDLDGQYEISSFGYAYHDIELSVAPEVGDVDVYKVNHHASSHSNSATFIKQIDPEVSIVTVGDGNTYGHPAQLIMDRLLDTSVVYMTERGDTNTDIGSAIVAGHIVIKTSTGSTYTVNGFSYTATEPVRIDTDGDGYFVEADLDDNNPGLFPAPNGGCGPVYQTCSVACQVTEGQVLINEVFPAPSSGTEWVELYNTTSSTINIGYCYIDDIVAGSTAYQIPAGTIIPAYGFWTLDRNNYFNNLGDDVRFLKEDASAILDSFTYEATGSDTSWYRFPDGGVWSTEPTVLISRGQSNNTPFDPMVLRSIRDDPNPTSNTSVGFTVTFSKTVIGVDVDDFILASTGVTNASITTVNGTGTTYKVTVNTGIGNGTIRLDVPDTATITDLAGNSLTNLLFEDGETYDVDKSVTSTFKSQGAYDGWILESFETSNKGGTMNSTANLLYVGDNAQDKQYKSFLSFDTSSLPDGSVITNAQLKINIKAFTGGNMFTPTKALGNLLMDISTPYFGTKANLAVGDFQAIASKNSVGTLASAPAVGWYTITLKTTSFLFIKLDDTTQFRLRFQKDDNDDLGADYLKIYSGDAGDVNSPQLIVEYYVP